MEGYVAVQGGDIAVYSCSFPPNKSLEEFEAYLACLEEIIARKRTSVIITGDFNAKSEEWHFGRTDFENML